MIKDFLQKFQENLFQKRKTFAILLPLILAIAIFYPLKTHAIAPLIAYGLIVAATPIIIGVATAIFSTLTFIALVTGLQLISLLFGKVILWIGTSMLDWGIKGGPFAYWSMTNPANNPIIQIGWTVLRDLTNMFFILGLAYIGLATALNFASFNTKKTFTTLIIVALLINFTPVICGLIIDGTNIIMNFFLSEVNFNGLAEEYNNIAQNIPVPNKETLAQPDWLIRTVMAQLYSTITGMVLFIFGALLLLRHFIIWVLVILSPVAFFLRIFDFSKQWFTKWWAYFVSWAWIGIPAAFFLYLGNHLMVLAKSGQISGSTTDLGWGQGYWTKLTPYLIVTMFSVIALISTLKIKAAGSGLIIGLANKVAKAPGTLSKKVGLAAGTAVGAMAGAVAGGKIAAIGLKGAPQPGTKEFEDWEKTNPRRAALKKAGRWITGGQYTDAEKTAMKTRGWHRKAGRAVVRTLLTPLTGGATLWYKPARRAATAQMREILTSQVKEGESTTKGKTYETQEANYRSAIDSKNTAAEIGALKGIIGDGNLADCHITPMEIEKTLTKAVDFDPDSVNDVLRFVDPETAERVSITLLAKARDKERMKITLDRAGISWDPTKPSDNIYGSASEKIIAKMKAGKAGSMSRDAVLALAKATTSDAGHKYWTGAHIAKFAELHGREFVNAFNAGKKASAPGGWYATNNSGLDKYLTSDAAKTLGIGF